MPVYQGNVQIKDLYNEIVNKIQDSGLWTNVSSLASDGCWKSTGTSGTDNVFVVIRDKNTQTVSAQHALTLGIAEGYTPGASGAAGTFTNLTTNDYYLWSAAATSNTVAVAYTLLVDADCIILGTVTDQLVSGALINFAYIGLPVRYDTETNSFANLIGTACSFATANVVKVVKNKAGAAASSYSTYSFATQVPANPGWGNKYAAYPIMIGTTTEGLRGELKSVLCMPASNILNADTVVINNTTYKVFLCTTYGLLSFPTKCLLLPIS